MLLKILMSYIVSCSHEFSVRLSLYESAGHCVEICPDGLFGNGTTGQCQQCKF